MEYKILKIYNNNVVLAMQEDKTVVLVSKGIGFGRKIGQVIEGNHGIEKVFHEITPDDELIGIKNSDKDCKLESVVDQMIKLAEIEMGKLNTNARKTIYEHIQFALDRIEMGLTIENPFIEEIISLYPKEFQIAGVAAKLIKQVLDIDIGDEEKGLIALHLRSARDNKPIRETLKATRVYKRCIQLVEERFERKIDLRAKKSKAFLKNLDILIDEAKKNEMIMPAKESIKSDLVLSYKIAEEVGAYIQTQKQIDFTADIIAYLAVEIEKLRY